MHLNWVMSVKSKAKLVRIVLGSTVGSLLWAGCAQPRMAVTDQALIAQAPVDMTNRRPDTHPHLRTGIWGMNSENPTANVVLTPTVTTPDPLPGTANSAYLLGYSSEVINAIPPEGQNEIIIEAAGAETTAPRRTWRERLFRRSAPRSTPPQVERYEREIIIEREVEPQPDGYRPSSDEVDTEEGGKLRKTFFVKK